MRVVTPACCAQVPGPQGRLQNERQEPGPRMRGSLRVMSLHGTRLHGSRCTAYLLNLA